MENFGDYLTNDVGDDVMRDGEGEVVQCSEDEVRGGDGFEDEVGGGDEDEVKDEGEVMGQAGKVKHLISMFQPAPTEPSPPRRVMKPSAGWVRKECDKFDVQKNPASFTEKLWNQQTITNLNLVIDKDIPKVPPSASEEEEADSVFSESLSSSDHELGPCHAVNRSLVINTISLTPTTTDLDTGDSGDYSLSVATGQDQLPRSPTSSDASSSHSHHASYCGGDQVSPQVAGGDVPIEHNLIEPVHIENIPKELVHIEHIPKELVHIEHIPREPEHIEHIPKEAEKIEHIPKEAEKIERIPIEIVEIQHIPIDPVKIDHVQCEVFPPDPSSPVPSPATSEEHPIPLPRHSLPPPDVVHHHSPHTTASAGNRRENSAEVGTVDDTDMKLLHDTETKILSSKRDGGGGEFTMRAASKKFMSESEKADIGHLKEVYTHMLHAGEGEGDTGLVNGDVDPDVVSVAADGGRHGGGRLVIEDVGLMAQYHQHLYHYQPILLEPDEPHTRRQTEDVVSNREVQRSGDRGADAGNQDMDFSVLEVRTGQLDHSSLKSRSVLIRSGSLHGRRKPSRVSIKQISQDLFQDQTPHIHTGREAGEAKKERLASDDDKEIHSEKKKNKKPVEEKCEVVVSKTSETAVEAMVPVSKLETVADTGPSAGADVTHMTLAEEHPPLHATSTSNNRQVEEKARRFQNSVNDSNHPNQPAWLKEVKLRKTQKFGVSAGGSANVDEVSSGRPRSVGGSTRRGEEEGGVPPTPTPSSTAVYTATAAPPTPAPPANTIITSTASTRPAAPSSTSSSSHASRGDKPVWLEMALNKQQRNSARLFGRDPSAPASEEGRGGDKENEGRNSSSEEPAGKLRSVSASRVESSTRALSERREVNGSVHVNERKSVFLAPTKSRESLKQVDVSEVNGRLSSTSSLSSSEGGNIPSWKRELQMRRQQKQSVSEEKDMEQVPAWKRQLQRNRESRGSQRDDDMNIANTAVNMKEKVVVLEDSNNDKVPVWKQNLLKKKQEQSGTNTGVASTEPTCKEPAWKLEAEQRRQRLVHAKLI